MLLENNNISFEAKLSNIRQKVEETFGSNEEPITDDFMRFVKNTSKNSETDTEGEDAAVSDFTDLGDIHSLKSGEIHHEYEKIDNENTIIFLPKEDLATHNSISTEQISKCIQFGQDGFANKENIQLEKLNELNSISKKFKTLDLNSASDQKMESGSRDTKMPISNNLTTGRKDSFISKTHVEDKQKPISSIDGIRQVNVEMFTVILKSKTTKLIQKTDP